MKFFGYDLETTGVNPATDKPVQISLVHADDQGYQRVLINTLCNPCQLIDPEASMVHGITEAQLRSAPDYLFALYQVQLVVATMRKDELLITMNGKSFDLPMTEACIGQNPFAGMLHFDVYQAACRYFPELKGRKLGQLYQFFFNETLSGAHDATADTLAAIRVAQEMTKHTHTSLQEMAKDLAVPKPYPIMPFGKYAGLTLDEIPKSWAKWMSNQPSLSDDLRATVDYVLSV